MMKLELKSRVTSWGLPIALAAVLLTLAVMQYRWSAEVSNASRARMRSNLQNSLMSVRQDLTRELATMRLELENDTNTPPEAQVLAQKLHHWQKTTPQPGLIANVYFWDGAEHEAPSLLHLLPSEGRFERSAWPAEFGNLHAYYSTFPGPVRAGLGPAHPEPGLQEPSMPPPPDERSGPPTEIEESIPALVFPAAHGRDSGWLLLELDKNALKGAVFPQLIERHFGDPQSSEYEIAVVGGTGARNEVL